jgi:hypothetical protein
MNTLHESLTNFLKSDSLNVAVLKGEWGVGKTYFWKRFLKEQKGNLPFRAYSYVSLFGIKEISEVKSQVLSNFQILNEVKITKHLEKLKPLSAILKSIEIPFFNSAAAITELVENSLIENFLICFDDLERKEDSISASSLLGLVSQLKEEKNCKVILIYNDNELNAEAVAHINEYREKVVDIELTYRPTIEDNLSVVWSDGCTESVANVFKSLELNNIRIMQKVKSTQDYFSDFITKNYPHLTKIFLFKCTALTVIHHAFSKTLPIQDVLKVNFYSILDSKEEEDKERFKILEKLDYRPEDQDSLIVEYLINGHADFVEFEDLLQSRDEFYRISAIHDEYRGIWSSYYRNFIATQDEFISHQKSFIRSHISDLGIADVDSAIGFIKQLDPAQDVEQLLEDSIELYISKIKDLPRDRIFMHNLRPETRARIMEKLVTGRKEYSLAELFVALAGSDSWDSTNLQYLDKYSKEDIYNWIVKEKSADVMRLLKEFLVRFSLENSLIDKIHTSLDKVKRRSPIDRCRVELILGER